MSGVNTGTLVATLRRGTWVEYTPRTNIGIPVAVPRRGTWVQYGGAPSYRPGLRHGVVLGRPRGLTLG